MSAGQSLSSRLAGTTDAETAQLIAEAKAKSQELDPDNLPEGVSSAAERRCPFLYIWSDAADTEVDSLCDVRIQTFADTPPFGPKDLKVCELCLNGKTFQANIEAAATLDEEIENARKAPGPPPKDDHSVR